MNILQKKKKTNVLSVVMNVMGIFVARNAKKHTYLKTNVWWLGEVPPCRMLNYSTKACGGILPNHCYKPFLFVFGLTI